MSFDQAPAPIHAAQRESRAQQRTPDVIGVHWLAFVLWALAGERA